MYLFESFIYFIVNFFLHFGNFGPPQELILPVWLLHLPTQMFATATVNGKAIIQSSLPLIASWLLKREKVLQVIAAHNSFTQNCALRYLSSIVIACNTSYARHHTKKHSFCSFCSAKSTTFGSIKWANWIT